MFRRIADLTWTRPKTVLAIVGVFAVIAGAFGSSVEDRLRPAGFDDPASESRRAEDRLLAKLGYDSSPGLVILLAGRQEGQRLDLRDPAIAGEIERLSKRLKGIEHVAKVNAPLGKAADKLVARDRRSALITAHLDTSDEEIASEVAEVAETRVSSDLVAVSHGGFAASFNEVNDTTREDLIRAELIAFPILFLLLLVVFRGLVAALIPLAIGGISILGTFFGLRVMSEFTDTSIFALNIATALGLGLAVDYGLLLVSRFREEIERAGGATREAHRRVVETAGRTVMYSGLTVAAAMAALTILPQRFLYSMGAGGAIVALIASVAAFLTVPAILALLGERINALSVRRGAAVSDTSGGWYRLARGVMRRPVPVALASAGVLLAAAVPVLGMQTTGPSSQTVPPGKESRDVTETIAASYESDIQTPITVTVAGKTSDRELARLGEQISSLPAIASANPFTRASRDTAFATFGSSGPSLGEAPQDAVREIRDLEPPGDGRILVSGNTASFIDLKQSLLDNAPGVVALVALTTLFLLFMLTGSVILPLKTLVMNALTMAATVGILVLAFQEELLHGLVDFNGPSALEASMLVVLFAVTFGLATDYAVLVMARIKELHDQGLSNEEAVATGIGRTGRVISAAALLLAVVFLAFTTSSIFFMKEVGIGQAVGVIIDATIVRALLVPALMRIFGDWNWWAPAPLARFQGRWGFQET